ncbi:ABC transporter permease [Eupransor demetentiae]|uniref:Permease component (SalY) n=1 Tax=Eupransor demetentiae TaxID=3109584 RepID=A0ABP0ES08_9LACO|nr:ABC-type antimicrobial peptide transport system [Lactobacillaceae bacterium LMG 33000]
MLYWKLALDSLRKNMAEYLPFLLVGSAAVALNFIIQLLLFSSGVQHLYASQAVLTLLGMAQVVIGILSLIFLFYTYSFLRKKKQAEFGLYSILGLKKSDLMKISFLQQTLTLALDLIAGLVTGFVMSKLSILLLIRLVEGTNFELGFSTAPLAITLFFFAGIFVLLFLYDCWTIIRTKTLNLLKAGKKGTTSPKNRWILFILGALMLGCAYYLALTVSSPIKAMQQFFIAVLLVIFATYFLFVAGSTLVLKIMKGRPSFYQKSKRFITVSNMLFRMKQNAVGLASITLLTTMTLVVTVTTSALFFGRQTLIDQTYPRDIQFTSMDSTIKTQNFDQLAKKYRVKIKDGYQFQTSQEFSFDITKNHELKAVEDTGQDGISQSIQLMTLSQFKKLGNQNVPNLKGNEIAFYSSYSSFKGKQLKLLDGHQYTVKKHLSGIKGIAVSPSGSSFIIVPDQKVLLNNLPKSATMHRENPILASYYFNLVGSKKDITKFSNAMQEGDNFEAQNHTRSISTSSYDDKRALNTFFGGFFFIGLLFSVSFILATALMIYYKQVTEGQADQKQFNILTKLGMSRKEIKACIRTQLVWLFGLPIAVAITHLSFAMLMITKVLRAFGVTNDNQVYLVIAGTILLMIAIYYLVYLLTSCVYYKKVTQLREN